MNQVTFNQDSSCISCATNQGFYILNTNPFGKIYSNHDESIAIVQMLFCTSLVALVSNPHLRKLKILNTKRQSIICELTFPTKILSIQLNRKRLCIILESTIYIYDISNMHLLHQLDTANNSRAISSLSPSSTHSYLAYPSPPPPPLSSASTPSTIPSTAGVVLIFNTLTLSLVSLISAHKSPLALINLNPDGTLLATASDKGTVIRIFNSETGERVYEFRRGRTEVIIGSISFNAVSSLIAVSSDTDTVHIFKLSQHLPPSSSSSSSKYDHPDTTRRLPSTYSDSSSASNESAAKGTGSIRKRSINLGKSLLTSSSSYFLPERVSGIWEPRRDFAFCKLPSSSSINGTGNGATSGGRKIKSVVALSSQTPHVMILTSDGLFHSYSIDLELGGECVLQKSFSLLESASSASSIASTDSVATTTV